MSLDAGLSPSLARNPELDSWVSIRADRTIAIRTGKVEIGQGILTALVLIAADELAVDPSRITILPADTDVSPNEGYTAGSLSVEHGGLAVRQACAHARRILLMKAARRLDVGVDALRVVDGVIDYSGANETTDYWALHAEQRFDCRIEEVAVERTVDGHRWVGVGMPRVDLAAKLTGGGPFIQDLATSPDEAAHGLGLLHARVVRPASGGRPPERASTLINEHAVRAEANERGVDNLVINGSFVALANEREEIAVRHAEWLVRRCNWRNSQPSVNPVLSSSAGSSSVRRDLLSEREVGAFQLVDGVPETGSVAEFSVPKSAGPILSAEYSRPFLMHGSLAPSAAIAEWREDQLNVWSHSQGPAVLRQVLARALMLEPEDVRVIHAQNAGCYGHNGADDVALDAALVAMANPGRRVLMKWSREQEHGWEPYGPMMRVRMRAALDAAGRIAAWSHDVWSFTHVARPLAGAEGALLVAAWQIDPPSLPPLEQPILAPEVGVHRNAWPLYQLPSPRVVKHFCAPAPFRTSALRGLGAHANVFAIESFMSELAVAAGTDPVAFRLDHLTDERARAVLEGLAAFADMTTTEPGRGLGVAVARYKNSAAYAAVAVGVVVDAVTANIDVRKLWICADAGQVIDPDGLVNQLEGGAIQALSWTLKEAVVFDDGGVTSLDWDSYPILKFSEVPEVSTRLIDRPELPPLGAGEATQGPTAAALANAIFDATGLRLRDMPLTPERLRAAAAL